MKWKPILGYPNYEISNSGLVRSVRFNRILKASFNNSGYAYVNLIQDRIVKTTAVHKLVLEHFGSEKPSENFVIDHLDGNKKNNSIDNLEWVSIQENTTRAYGNQDKKMQIIELHKKKKTIKEISKIVGLSPFTVNQTILKSRNHSFSPKI